MSQTFLPHPSHADTIGAAEGGARVAEAARPRGRGRRGLATPARRPWLEPLPRDDRQGATPVQWPAGSALAR